MRRAILAGHPAGEVAGRIAQPIGRLSLDALTMTVVPLVFALLVSGVMSAAAQGSDGTIAA